MASTTATPIPSCHKSLFDCENDGSSRHRLGSKNILHNCKHFRVCCSIAATFGIAGMIGFFCIGPLLKHARFDSLAQASKHQQGNSLSKAFSPALRSPRRPSTLIAMSSAQSLRLGHRSVSPRASTNMEIPRLRAAEIKRRLTRFGIDPSGIFEMEELRSLLHSQIPEAAGAGHAVPLLQVGAMQGAMGSGVTVDSTKFYWTLRLELPEVKSPAAASQMRFVIDSAATNSLLSPAAAASLGAKPTGVLATSDTATTGTRQEGLKQVSLGESYIQGGFSSGVLSPVVMDLPVDAAGLLGLDFLSRHDIELYLRPSRPCAIFHPVGAATAGKINLDNLVQLAGRRIAPSGLLAVSLELRRPSMGTPTPKLTAILDLGSSNTVCNWAALESAGLRKGDKAVHEGSSVIAGAGGEPLRVSQTEVDLCFSENSLRRVTVSVADLPVFANIGLHGPAVVLGLDALAPKGDGGGERGGRLVLSAGENAVWLEA